MRCLIICWILSCLLLILLFDYSSCCKEALCASVVSKCLLIDACKCDIVNCTCCKACFQCLDSLFADCCDCVDMCPKAVSVPTNLSSTSHVEDLQDPIVELFNALTEEHDATGRWTTYTYPIQRDLTPFLDSAAAQNVRLGMVSKDSPLSAWPAVNCTVAFMSQCMPWMKCKNSCRSMGASSYRWFHDGCCQCVGSNCLNYGMNETRCLNCPRIAAGTMDDEYEGLDDEDRPRKHMETTNAGEDSQETAATERTPAPSPAYGPQTTTKIRPKNVVTPKPGVNKGKNLPSSTPASRSSVTSRPTG